MQTMPKEAMAASNGILIIRTGGNCFGVTLLPLLDLECRKKPRILKVEVDHLGLWYKEDFFDAREPYRDSLSVDLCECVIRVKEGDTVLCELGEPPQGAQYQPWMRVQGEQQHITENYISVPPALHLTDAGGARWTFGFLTASVGESPRGEFAFNVLKDGVDTGLIASRLELRNGLVRAFTRHGWKRWLGREWS